MCIFQYEFAELEDGGEVFVHLCFELEYLLLSELVF
jgi:hypothetical protein